MYKRYSKPNIILIVKPLDFRCGINTLVYLLNETYHLNPLDDNLYVFINKRKRAIKLLYWGGAGFWLITYKPSIGKFQWLKNHEYQSITYEQMEWLLNGLEIEPKKLIKKIDKTLI